MNTKCMLIILCAIMWRISSYSQATYNEADSAALRAIDDSCDTKDSLNWDRESDPGKWNGVIWNTSTPKQAVQVYVNGCGLTGSLDASTLHNMTKLVCVFNELTDLNVSDLTNLVELHCSGNQLTSLGLANLTNLKKLYCEYNLLTSLEVAELTNLVELGCAGNQLTHLEVSNLTNLELLGFYGNKLSSLEVANLTNLKKLYCEYNLLTSLEVANLTQLTTLNCKGNKLPFSSLATGLDVSEYHYNPQDTLFDPVIVAGTYVMDYSTEALIKNTITQFSFYKDGNQIEANTSGKYITTGPGQYYCNMTNGRFPDLMLTTTLVTITNTNPELSVSYTELNLNAEANSQAVFDVISNGAWIIACSESWVNVNPSSGINNVTVTVTAVSSNTSSESRTATITVTGGNTIRTITVVQAEANISIINGTNGNNNIIYPNPVEDKVNICLSPEDMPSTIAVYSLDGKQLLLMQTLSSITELDMDNYRPGIYIIRIITGNERIEKKIIKL